MSNLKDLIGQQNVKLLLKKAINKLPGHAFIFVGPTGIGKHEFAFKFSAGLLCDNLQNGDACGVCKSCICLREGTHPDYKEILLLDDDKTIKTDTIRKEIVGDISMMPQISKRKVYFIDADYLNEQSQNVLLKTLEEPPEYAILILSVADIKNILPTVVSRIMQIKFEMYSENELMQILTKRGYAENEKLLFAISISDGIIKNAIRILENEDSNNIRERSIDCMFDLAKGRSKDIFIKHFPFFNENKNVIDEIILYLTSWFRDGAVFLSGSADNKIINSDMKDKLINFCDINSLTPLKSVKCTKVCEKAKTDIGLNASFEICICEMLIRIRRELINA